jgi:hypothetical protein
MLSVKGFLTAIYEGSFVQKIKIPREGVAVRTKKIQPHEEDPAAREDGGDGQQHHTM